MDSHQLAQYIEVNNGISKPWLLVLLRLKKLEESRHNLTDEEYMNRLQDIHVDMMKLGKWWVGIEDQVF